MKTKKILSLLSLALVVLAVGACNEDDVKDIVEYNLTIVNNTDAAYDIWIDNPLTTHGFYPAGHIAANRSAVIHELDIGVNYSVHLVNEGATADPAVHARNVHSGDSDVTWTVNP